MTNANDLTDAKRQAGGDGGRREPLNAMLAAAAVTAEDGGYRSRRGAAMRRVLVIRNVALGTLLATMLGWATAPVAEARPFQALNKSDVVKRVQGTQKALRRGIAANAAGPIPEVISETMAAGSEVAGEIIDEFNAFGGKDCHAGSACERFSNEIVTMLDETLDLLDMVPVEAFEAKRVQSLRDRVKNREIRPFVLFLLYRAIGEQSPWLEVPYRITQTVEQMPAELLSASSNVLFGAPDDPYAFCGRVLVQDPARFKVWKARLGLVKPTIALISTIMHAVPDIEVGGEAGIAVANAQGGVTIKVGKIFDVVNKGVGLIVDQVSAVMNVELAKYEACNPS